MIGLSLNLWPMPASAPALALGPELVLNGNGGSLTGWLDASTPPATVSLAPGGFLLTAAGGQTARLRQEIAVEPGATYRITATRLGGASSGRIDIGTTAGGSQYVSGTDIDDADPVRLHTIVATSPDLWLNLYRANAGHWVAGNISVRMMKS
jgi:hypothetical protein